MGRHLPDDVRIALGPGETVTVMGRAGSRTFRGPGNYGPADPVRPGDRTPRSDDGSRPGGVSLSELERGRAGPTTFVVTGTAGPSARRFPVGRRVQGDARVTLRARDVITVLGPGGFLTLRGPGRFTLEAAMTAGGGRRIALARPQSGGPSPPPPMRPEPPPVLVDIGTDANICLTPGAQVALRRAEDADIFLRIEGARGQGAIMDWPRGGGMRPWPDNLPLTDGARYTLRASETAPPHIVTFRAIAAGEDPVATAEALIANGCQAQLDTLIAETALESD